MVQQKHWKRVSTSWEKHTLSFEIHNSVFEFFIFVFFVVSSVCETIDIFARGLSFYFHGAASTGDVAAHALSTSSSKVPENGSPLLKTAEQLFSKGFSTIVICPL